MILSQHFSSSHSPGVGCGSPILYLQHLAGCLAQRWALSGVIGQLPTHPRLALCLHQEGFLASGFWVDSTPGVHWPEMGGEKGGEEQRSEPLPARLWSGSSCLPLLKPRKQLLHWLQLSPMITPSFYYAGPGRRLFPMLVSPA